MMGPRRPMHVGWDDLDIQTVMLDLETVASVAAGLSVRALQAAFRRHRDQTPLDYLQQPRLVGAHRDLQGGDPTREDTVAVIAARWGFGDPGRFCVAYRQAYGRAPSRTQ